MFSFRAHLGYSLLLLTLTISSAGACGAPGAAARIVDIDARGEIALADGGRARIAGLDLGTTRDALAGWAGADLVMARLAPRPDRWGRWLADFRRADGAWLSDDWLDRGLARVAPEFETRDCEIVRLQRESRARVGRLGLWADPGAILDAGRGGEVAAREGRLVIVEGRVLRVGVGRARVYLDFARQGGFSVTMPRKAEAALRRKGVELMSLAGRTIRVRGVADNRFGPRIEVADPNMLELTGIAQGSKPGG